MSSEVGTFHETSVQSLEVGAFHKMSFDRRNLYQPFDRTLIDRFLGRRKILSVELLLNGKGNTNYKLRLSDGKAYILRLYSRDRSAGESYGMNRGRDWVPVPQEIDRGEGWSIFTFLPGKLLKYCPQYSAIAANTIAKISTVTFDSPGFLNRDGSVSPFPFAGVEGFITEHLANSSVHHWLGEELIEAIALRLLLERERLEELDRESRLVHGDFNPTNILIHKGRVSGILDWEFCHSGTPYMDIGNLLRHTPPHYHRAIASGLTAGGMSLPQDWKKRAELVDLTSHLEFLTSNRSVHFKQQCVTWIARWIREN